MSDHTRRSRSRSPRRSDHLQHHRVRPRSPRQDDRHHRRSSRKEAETHRTMTLPFGARLIAKHDLRILRPIFSLYLDIQKQKYIEDLPEDEVKGRWKSFVGKWNRGELAEGWYDPETLERALTAESEQPVESTTSDSRSGRPPSHNPTREAQDDDDDYGPPPPDNIPNPTSTNNHRTPTGPGPTIPTFRDLRAQQEQRTEDAQTARDQHTLSLQAARRAERTLQTSRLDDLLPRADPGTRARHLEKKRDALASARVFAAAKTDGGGVVDDLPDSEVFGDDDSLGALRRTQKQNERKKNEREIRREEALRARIAEREERARGIKEKEEKTMEMLKRIARARFGGE